MSPVPRRPFSSLTASSLSASSFTALWRSASRHPRRPRSPERLAGGTRRRQRCLLEPLEPRALLAVTVLEPLVEIPVAAEQAELQLAASGYFRLVEFGTEISGTLVRVDVNQPVGDTAFYMELFDQPGLDRERTTPATVANFLQYVDAGRFEGTIIHRSVPGFVVQGGGFTAPRAPIGEGGSVDNVETFAPVVNEPGNTNIRGTVAMAKLGGDPNSATSQWFVNLGDNSGNLDSQNGGFTAFARVLGDGMVLVDAMAAVPTFDYGGAFTDLPLRADTPPDVILPGQFVIIERVAAVHPFAYEVTAGPGIDAVIDQATGRLSVAFAPGFIGRSEVVVRASSFLEPDFVTAGSFGETQVVFDRDGTLPQVQSLAAVSPGPTNGPVVVDATFSVPVSFPSNAGITVVNGTVSSVTAIAGSGGLTHRIVVDPAADGPVTVGLAAGAAVDAFGNPSDAAANTVTVVSDRTPPTAAFAPIASPTAVPVSAATITFSEAVTGVTAENFTLTRNGLPVATTGLVVTGTGASRQLGGLAALTAAAGDYVLTLPATAAVTDAVGNPLAGSASVAWTVDLAPTGGFAAIDPVRSTPLESIAVSFSEPVTGVTLPAFELRRDGAVVPLDGATLTGSGASYGLSGLRPLGDAEGGYVLALNAAGSGITDATGNALAASFSTAWQLRFDDGLVPQASFAPIGTPRGGIDQVRIDFSEPVANLAVGNFQLRFGRRTVPLAGASLARVPGSSTAYVLSGIAAATARGGNYTLTLDTGYTDLQGNQPATPVTIRWLNVAGRPGGVAVPPAPAAAPVTPSLAALPATRTTPLANATVQLSEAVASFDPAVVGLTRDGRRVSLRGMNVSGGGGTWVVSNLVRATARPGEYVLSVGDTATAAANGGNATSRPLAGIARAVWRKF